MSAYRTFDVKRTAGALGAEICGLDLNKALSSDAQAELRAAWVEHLVIFFRDQQLSSAGFLALARCFGEPMEYAGLKALPDEPLITPVIKLEHQTFNFAGAWHSDTAYLQEPPTATALVAREVPPFGGDTLFANMYLAYDELSPGMKKLISDLHAINTSAKADAFRTREDDLAAGATRTQRQAIVAEHPVVRTHPESGRKSLYVNCGHTLRFRDMTEAESVPLLHYLFEHQVRPEFTCRFAWKEGSVAIWDNRCTLHNPINDYQGFRRVMHRVTLKGERPH